MNIIEKLVLYAPYYIVCICKLALVCWAFVAFPLLLVYFAWEEGYSKNDPILFGACAVVLAVYCAGMKIALKDGTFRWPRIR